MGRGAINFAGGLMNGWMAQDRYQTEQNRQDLRDAMTRQQFDTEQQAKKLQLDELQQTRADKEQLRAEARPVTVSENGSAVQGQDGAAYAQPDAATAQNAIDQERIENGGGEVKSKVIPAATVGGKAFVGPTGLSSAKAYANSVNDPDAINARQVRTLRMQGRPDAAMQLEKGYTEHKAKLFDLQRDASFNSLADAISKKGWDGAAEWYSHYPDGQQITFTPTSDGGAVGHITKDGKPVGQPIQFKSPDELLVQAHRTIFAKDYAKSRIATQAKIAEEQGKPMVLRPGDKIGSIGSGVTSNDDLKPGFEWAIGPSGDRYQRRADGKGDATNEKAMTDAMMSPPASLVSLPNPMDPTKHAQSDALVRIWQNQFQLLSGGGGNVRDIYAKATDDVMKLKEAASQDYQKLLQTDPKTTETLDSFVAKYASKFATFQAKKRANQQQPARAPSQAGQPSGTIPDGDRERIYQSEMAKLRSEVAAPGITPEQRRRLNGDIEAVQREMARLGFKERS